MGVPCGSAMWVCHMGVPCGLHLGVFSRVQYYDFGKIFAGKNWIKNLQF
jgi:hypothetical protein